MMRKKAAITAALAAAVAFGACLPASALTLPEVPQVYSALITGVASSKAAMTAALAREIASGYAPSDCEYKGVEDKGDFIEVELLDTDKNETYIIGIDKATQKPTRFTTLLNDRHGGAAVNITAQTATRTVEQDVINAKVLLARADKLGSDIVYEVYFQNSACYGVVRLHPVSGDILRRDVIMGAVKSGVDLTKCLTYEQTGALAIAKASGGKLTDIAFELDGSGSVQYAASVELNGVQSVYSFNAVSGASAGAVPDVTLRMQPKKNNEYSSSDFIGASRARSIALARKSSAKVRSCKLVKNDDDSQRPYYRVALTNGRYLYTCQIDAINGSLWGWEETFVGDTED